MYIYVKFYTIYILFIAIYIKNYIKMIIKKGGDVNNPPFLYYHLIIYGNIVIYKIIQIIQVIIK